MTYYFIIYSKTTGDAIRLYTTDSDWQVPCFLSNLGSDEEAVQTDEPDGWETTRLDK